MAYEEPKTIISRVESLLEAPDFWEACGLDYKIYFTSDLHLKHRNVISHCNRPYANEEEMDEGLITNINKVVAADDELYILGDFTAYGIKRGDGMRFRDQISCKNVHLIYGNHDKDYKACRVFQGLHNYLVLKRPFGKFILFHFPISAWDGREHFSVHLHGHIHANKSYNASNIKNGILRFDVGVDANNYSPVSLQTVMEWVHEAMINYSKAENSCSHHQITELYE